MNDINWKTQNIVENKQRKSIKLPLIALALDFAPAVCIGLIWLTDKIGMINSYVNNFLLLSIIFAPIIGIISGVVSLCSKKYRSVAGIIISVIAVALPIVLVLTIILLFQTGAVVIGM